MELAVAAGLAPHGRSAAVEKCPKLGRWRLSEPKLKNHCSTRIGSLYTELSGRTKMEIPIKSDSFTDGARGSLSLLLPPLRDTLIVECPEAVPGRFKAARPRRMCELAGRIGTPRPDTSRVGSSNIQIRLIDGGN